jgi:hypothetical protein
MSTRSSEGRLVMLEATWTYEEKMLLDLANSHMLTSEWSMVGASLWP